MASRERRPWTTLDDQLLLEAVQREDPGDHTPSKWHAIAQHVPNRSNRDCRKRWYTKMSSEVYMKGPWSRDEDERLQRAIILHGTRWYMVAPLVGTRNGDQCAKRWTDTLNPAINHRPWTLEEDATLLRAVHDHGKVWSKIVRLYFPTRTGLLAKNRYHSIIRTLASRDSRESQSTASSLPSESPALPATMSAGRELPLAPFVPSVGQDLVNVLTEQIQNATAETAYTTHYYPSYRLSYPSLPSSSRMLAYSDEPELPHFAPTAAHGESTYLL